MIDDGMCEHCGGIRALRGDDMGCNCHICPRCQWWPAEGWADYCQECINDMEGEEFAQLVLDVRLNLATPPPIPESGHPADTEGRRG